MTRSRKHTKKGKAAPLQAIKIDDLVRLLNDLSDQLFRTHRNHIKEPYPKDFRASVDEASMISIILVFDQENVDIPSDTLVWIRSTVSTFFSKKKFQEPPYQIIQWYDRTLEYDDAQKNKIIMTFAKNLSLVYKMPKLLNDVDSKLTVEEKIQFLSRSALTILVEAIKAIFPSMQSYKPDPARASIQYVPLIIQTISSIYNQFGDEVGAVFPRFKNRMELVRDPSFKPVEPAEISLVEKSKEEVEADQAKHKQIQLSYFRSYFQWIEEQSFSKRKLWNIYSTAFTCLQDAFDSYEAMEKIYTDLEKQITASKKLLQAVKISFSGIDKNAQVLLLGNCGDLLEQCELVEKFIREDFHENTINKYKPLQVLNQQKDFVNECLLMVSDKLESLSIVQPSTKTFTRSSSQPKPVVTEHVSQYQAQSAAVLGEATVSTVSLSDTISSGFFAPASSASTSSTTAEIKREAEETIRKMEKREEKHQNRSNNSVVKEEQTERVSQENLLFIHVQYNNQTYNLSASVLNKMAKVYVCFDCTIFMPRSKKLDAFIAVGKREKILMQTSLGQSGIKIYGLNCLIIKCRQYRDEHLIFIAFKVGDKRVYFPYAIIPHGQYELLLDSKTKLQEYSEQARNGVTLTIVEENKAVNRMKC